MDTPQETVVPATLRSTYTSASLLTPGTQSGTDGAGAQEVFHHLEGNADLVWTRYSDNKSIPIPVDKTALMKTGTGSDTLSFRHTGNNISLWDATDNTTRTLHIPDGQNLGSVYGTTGVASENYTDDDRTTARAFHLLTPAADGTTRDVPVSGLPAGMELWLPRAADGTSLLFFAKLDGSFRMVAVDRETGPVQSWTQPVPVSYSRARLSEDHIVVYAVNNTKVLVLPRSDLSAPPTELVLDGAGSVNPAEDLAVVGDWVVHRPSAGTVVLAKPLAGGATVTVVRASNLGVSSASGDSAVVLGRTTADNWGIQRITPGTDGRPVVTTVKPLPRPAARIQGLSLEQGRLVVTDPISGDRAAYLRTVSPAGTPEFGARSAFTGSNTVIADCLAQDAGCSAIQGTADGRVAWLERRATLGSDLLRVYGAGQYPCAFRARRRPHHRCVRQVRDLHGHQPAIRVQARRLGRPRDPRQGRGRRMGR
ncbi:hypothetical protein KQY30_35510 [Streptomyces sp. GMY02]|uniref:hypothetical protein n=1 Tax=Streptomyces sp. GMY02 TaxID=1333528 RepID=UPI001C2BC278|nr:hypothetical protein [Streptomyces sp. GMY02]QXE38731.1 hypothetical protein KQY30_35510 [Streptomyces sp. GMY02]